MEAGERSGAVGVDAEMLPDGRVDSVAIVGQGGAREVEGSAIERGDYLYGVGVIDVVRGAEDFEGSDGGCGGGEGGEERCEVLGAEERFVALDVDVDVCGVLLGDGVDAVGAAGEIGAGDDEGPGVMAAESGDLVGVCGDEDGVELGAGAGGVVDPCEHGSAGDFAQDFARETGGGEARRDDAESAGAILFRIQGHVSLTLPDTARIMGDGGTDRLYDSGAAIPTHTRRCSSDG